MAESMGAEKARIKEQRDIFFKALSKIYILDGLDCYATATVDAEEAGYFCDEYTLCGACETRLIISKALQDAGDVR